MTHLQPNNRFVSPELRHAGPRYLTRTGIAFRVIALDGEQPNWTSTLDLTDLTARHPQAPATTFSVEGHLRWWHNIQTPWISVFRDWSRALNRAEWYVREKQARTVYVAMIDMEQARPDVDAEVFAYRHGFPNLPYYKGEYLYRSRIPREAVLAIIPASEPRQEYRIWLAKMQLPEDFLLEATRYRLILGLEGLRVECHALWWWFYENGNVDSDPVLINRLLDALCVERYDDLWDE
jgi:hypothetical protein